MGVTAHGFWYPDPTTPSSLQGLLSAAATAQEAALVKNNVIAGVPVAASTAGLTALYTAQGASPTVGSLGSVGGAIYWWTGTIWQNSDAVYATVISGSAALATVSGTWKAHTYATTTYYPTGGYSPGVGGGAPAGITITATGTYRWEVMAFYSPNATGRRGLGVGTVAAASPNGMNLVLPTTAAGVPSYLASGTSDFTAGDQVCGYSYQDSGVNTVTVAARSLRLELVPGI